MNKPGIGFDKIYLDPNSPPSEICTPEDHSFVTWELSSYECYYETGILKNMHLTLYVKDNYGKVFQTESSLVFEDENLSFYLNFEANEYISPEVAFYFSVQAFHSQLLNFTNRESQVIAVCSGNRAHSKVVDIINGEIKIDNDGNIAGFRSNIFFIDEIYTCEFEVYKYNSFAQKEFVEVNSDEINSIIASTLQAIASQTKPGISSGNNLN